MADTERWLDISRQKMDGIRVWAGDHWALDDVCDLFEATLDWMEARQEATIAMNASGDVEAMKDEAYDAIAAADAKLYELAHRLVYVDGARRDG